MKTVVLTGSPKILYHEPRRISPYMAAIIRRHRFVILAIIGFLILMTLSWHFRRKEEYMLKNTPFSQIKENLKVEVQMFRFNKQYLSNINKITDNIEEKTQLIDVRNRPEDVEISPFIPINIGKQHNEYQVEKSTSSIHAYSEQLGGELANLEIGDKNTHVITTIQYPETKTSSPSKAFIVDTKHSYLEEQPRSGKKVSLSPIQHPVVGFPVPNQADEWTKTHVTFSLIANNTNTTNLFLGNNSIMLNQQESIPIESNINTHKNAVLLIDTPGCKIPKLDPWDPTVKHLIKLQEPYDCPGPPVFMKSNPGGSITYNKTILETYYNTTAEELICYYKTIHRTHEGEWNREINWHREVNFVFGNESQLEFGVPIDEDHVSVSCHINEQDYEQLFPLVRLKQNIEEERDSIIPPNPTLNVILVGIDSVSKLNFLRHFPKTHAFLKDKLKPFEMNGYTKVGDNTFPNLVPLLTGRFVEHWWNETLMDTMYFDNIDLIWKEYAKRGYRTIFAEDSPFTGTFNYLKRGFHNPPTDYYLRPLALVMETWKFFAKPEKEFCWRSQKDIDIVYDYLKDFTQTMKTKPYFGFAMVSTITHDRLNYATWADEPTERLLNDLLTTGALNNTVLVLFSDHGLRFGEICQTYVGKFEERLPLMYIHVPKWFLDQQPEIAKSLQVNQNRLMTLFDIHATMLHILDLNKTHDERSSLTLGGSLFEEITPNRTCLDSNIEAHWCPCQIFDIVSINNPEVLYASQAIVDDINSKLEPYGGICEILEVDVIIDARVGKANDNMLHYQGKENEAINKTISVKDKVISLDDFMITLTTKPGGAVFVGTVRRNPAYNTYNVLGLSRISMYGNTSWCIDSQKMKIFCYCKIQHLS